VSANTPTARTNRAWQVLGSVLLGVVVAVVGTGVHRANQPWGLVLAYLTVVSAGVLARAWGRASALAAYGLGLLAMVLAMAFWGPGGDVLVADQGIGYAWVAAPALVLVVALLPGRLFSDRPMVRRQDPGQPS
jgi:peptidoglycan/LPS O-acetylase OafA/YrhL